MITVFLIITYGDNYLKECINSIRKYYKEIPICVVNNNLNVNNKLEGNNIYYQNNEKNNYELGAIWFALKKWPLAKKFIILHNSMILINKLPDFIFEEEFVPFWRADVISYSPVIPKMIEMLKKVNIEFEYNHIWKSICGCCCSINTDILLKLKDLKCDELYACEKFEAVATEILFGYLIDIVLKLKYNNELYDHAIYEHWNNNKKYKTIKKTGYGQGSSSSKNVVLPKKYAKLILYNKKISKNDNLIENLKIVNNNKEFGDFLSNQIQTDITCNKNLSNIMNSIKHRMFTKKYFPDYYNKEYEDIINKRKIIFN